jgi:hypothetical protein
MRVTATEYGFIQMVIRFFDVPLHRRKSLAWQKKVCRAVGLLYDYTVAVPPPSDPRRRTSYLSDFVEALTAGTVKLDGSDPTGLRWLPMGWNSTAEIIGYVNQFADFCSKELETSKLNPETAATFAERIAAYRRLDIRNSHSLLKHLGNAKSNHKIANSTREVVAPRSPKITEKKPPFFSRDSFPILLAHGFRQRQKGTLAQQYNLRDMMIAILERHGGLRVSEPFHMFVTDVREDRHHPGHAEVRLYHPELGRFSYKNPLTGKIIHVKRREYLRERYQRVPRNLETDKEHAGWKELMLDHGPPDSYAVVR